jgi:Transglutaminase-like superfamily
MSQLFAATESEIIEQILVQCWLFEARSGDRAAALNRAERTLERLLSKGLPSSTGPRGLLLDPYTANNRIKSRVGEPADEAWQDWQRTTRRNAASLPQAPHRYRFLMRREWHSYTVSASQQVILRLPLPLRGAPPRAPKLRLLEPAGALIDMRESPGRLELRVRPPADRGPIVAELEVEFVAGEVRDPLTLSAPLGSPIAGNEELWLRDREALISSSVGVTALAQELARDSATARDFVHRAWRWLMVNLQFGDVHREHLDATDALGGLLREPLADCILGSSLLIALCRARGIPARLVSGYLLHPANVGPHSWAEIRIAPDLWIPVDFGSWCYSAGDPDDPVWGNYFLGRVDARFLAEVAPRDFTGWGSAAPPNRWFRLERLRGDRIEHTLHSLPDSSLFRRDLIGLEVLGPAEAPEPGTFQEPTT